MANIVEFPNELSKYNYSVIITIFIIIILLFCYHLYHCLPIL